MKVVAAAASLALLGTRYAESSAQPWQAWGPHPFSPQPLADQHNTLPASAQQQQQQQQQQRQPGATPWWQTHPSLHQSGAPQPPPQVPAQTLPRSLHPPQFLMQQHSGLVQHRTRMFAPATPSDTQAGANPFGVSNTPASQWKESNTGRAAQELLEQLNRLFRRPDGEKPWAPEVFIPVENAMSTLGELSKLIAAVITYCETERIQHGIQGGFVQSAQPAFLNQTVAGRFPVNDFINQGSEFARRMTDQMRAVRELLSTLVSPTITKDAMQIAIQQFKSETADAKQVYQLGAQVSNAAVGAVLPYMSTCSLFPKGDTEGTYKLWSLVGARITSTLRYLYHTLKVVCMVSGKLSQHISGKVQPQSVQDFARSRPIFGAANHLKTAAVRSVSAMRYFNELADRYNNLTQPSAIRPIAQPSDANTGFNLPVPLDERDQQTIDTGMNAELSLMAEDLDEEAIRPAGKDAAASLDLDEYDAMQTTEDESTPVMWTPGRPPAGFENDVDDEFMMQTVGSD